MTGNGVRSFPSRWKRSKHLQAGNEAEDKLAEDRQDIQGLDYGDFTAVL